MPLQKKLEQLNIPEREAQVYITLLQMGLTSVGPIVTKTKLHRMLVYQSLQRLKDMRLASVVMKNGRQHWQATNPSIILDRVERQQELAKTVVGELELLQKKNTEEINVQILYGRSGLIENLETVIRSASNCDKKVRIIGGANDTLFYKLLGDWYQTYVDLQKQHGVVKCLIAPSDYAGPFNDYFKKEPNNEFRLLEYGLSAPTFTRITEEMVSIEVYGNEPIIIQMINPSIAKAYIESFELLWQQATIEQ